MAARIKKTGKVLLRKASRDRIRDYFVGLVPPERNSTWLRANNRYRVNCVGQFAVDRKKGSVNDAQLIDYVAACAPGHAIDGWSFLGRAIESALRRDPYSALHFAYYAELRAAMALLAAEGIGILSNKHPVVRQDGTTADLPMVEIWEMGVKKSDQGGTHRISWPYLRHWSTFVRAATLFDQIVQPAGASLSEWLDACGATVPTKAVATKWMAAWGLDLSRLSEDHDNRNLVSYRPSEFRLPPPVQAREVVTFVTSLWHLFEPSAAGSFPILERYLLRRALHLTGQKAPTVAQIGALGIGPQEAQEWSTFLSQNNYPLPFDDAETDSPIENARCHLQIIARAAFLLYFATGACRLLLRTAGYVNADLAFWWMRVGEMRGLWGGGGTPPNPIDTWADVESSLDDCRTYLDEVENPSLREVRRAPTHFLDDMGAWENVAMWGLMT